MEFGNAALLAGMALGAIPVIIHLINRQRAKLRHFAAIEFLLLSDKRIARRLKLKQLLVLALRVLLLAALAFALAKPYVAPDQLAAPDASAPGGVAIVIDDSLSMQAVADDGETYLDKAVARARELVDAGGARTSFAIVAAGAPARLLTSGLTYDKAAAERALDRVTPGARRADFVAAITEAGRALSQSSEPRRQLVLIGDQQAAAWADLGGPWTFVPVTEVDVVDVREGKPVENAAVEDVAVRRADGAAPGALEVAVTVANHGAADRQVKLEVELGDRVTADLVAVPAGEKVEKRFTINAPGAVRGVARIDPDALPADDAFFFTVAQSRALNVLVVNGAPRGMPFLDEIFFLRAALRVPNPQDMPLAPVFATSAELRPAQIAPMDVVILANVGGLTQEQDLALENFVRAGGGLFITGGDELTPESARSYGALLPYPIRDVKNVAKPGDPKSALSALTLSSADFGHPVMEVFDGVDDASLFKAQVFSYVLVDPAGQADAKVVASYTGGVPAIVESTLGQGRVMLLTTTVDRDWSDLAIRSSFVPLVQRVCQYLGHALDRKGGLGYIAGESARVRVPPGTGPLRLLRPDGGTVDYEQSASDGDALFLDNLDMPGQYTLERAGDKKAVTPIAVNADRRESDFQPVASELVAQTKAALTRDNGILPELDPAEPALVASGVGAEGRTLLWPYILAALFLLFGAEAWLVVKS
ncbi:MAG: BatA domain-containing protein [Myxococcales bacterium]|nr:BatA domain-containing protein [Myxococcales bacterium]MCB9734659.1 BatA domain-containing protein [Deltaproteobacteria bacterium]